MTDEIKVKAPPSERRRYPRFNAPERALVAVNGDDYGLPYHLIDISEGGMAFRYLNENPLAFTDSQMDIYINRDLYVGRLPATVVADFKSAGGLISRRRCCVQFGTLTPAQQTQLQAFIQGHALVAQPSY